MVEYKIGRYQEKTREARETIDVCLPYPSRARSMENGSNRMCLNRKKNIEHSSAS